MNKGNDDRGIYRAIYVSLWDDPGFRELSPNVKLVFLNLRTSPLTNMPVIYPYYVEAIEKQTGLSKPAILKAINTLSDTHWIAIQEGIVWVKKGLKFDPTITLANPKHESAIKKVVLSLPKLQIVRDFIDFYKINIPYPIPYRIPYANQEPEPEPEPEKEPEKDKEKEKVQEEEKPKIKDLVFSLSKSKDLNLKTDLGERRRILEEQKKLLGVKS